MAQQRRTVENVEFAGGTAIANPEPVRETAAGDPSTWKVGQSAPKTLYLTEDGKIAETQPTGRAKVLVVEGDLVTNVVANRIREATAAPTAAPAHGTVDEVLAEVGGDPDKAAAALAAEQSRDEPRTTLVERLQAIVDSTKS